MKNLSYRGDIRCRFRFGVDVFRVAAIAPFLGKPGAFSVMNVPQLRLDQGSYRPVPVEGGGWWKRDTDGDVIADGR
jgi:hypothetical protein